MSRELLRDTLVGYEDISNISPNILLERSNIKELEIMDNDIVRTKMFVGKRGGSHKMKKLYFLILYLTFKSFSLEYIQGMMDFSTIFMDVYFREAVSKYTNESETVEDTSEDSIGFDSITFGDLGLYYEFKAEYPELFRKFRAATINLLSKYNLYLANDNFKNYYKYAHMFLDIMSKKPGSPLLAYFQMDEENDMSREIMVNSFIMYTLTLFRYFYNDYDSAFTMMNFILKSRPQIVFSILTFYFENVIIGKHDEKSDMKYFDITKENLNRIADFDRNHFIVEEKRYGEYLKFAPVGILVIAVLMRVLGINGYFF